MRNQKIVIGAPLVIDGRKLSLSRAIRAGDHVYLTGQIPMQDGRPMTTGSIEDQTRAVLDAITETLSLAGCTRGDVVKAMVWLRDRADFPGFNTVYGAYFPDDPPARSAIISDLLVDCRVEVEVVAWQPQPKAGA
jgi:2-iminobutanoate/2-iminopropanoate deaminase